MLARLDNSIIAAKNVTERSQHIAKFSLKLLPILAPHRIKTLHHRGCKDQNHQLPMKGLPVEHFQLNRTGLKPKYQAFMLNKFATLTLGLNINPTQL